MNGINENIKKFAEERYPMSTGSEEWWNIKTDFEIIGDKVMGIEASKDFNESIDPDKCNDLKKELQEFKIRVDAYKSQDATETGEKAILQKKIKIALEISSAFLENVDNRKYDI